MLVFSLVTRWIENVEERENKRISMEKYEKNEEDREKSVQTRRTFLEKQWVHVLHELTLLIV
jgi:uncharacterized UBP type Zn finger protein